MRFLLVRGLIKGHQNSDGVKMYGVIIPLRYNRLLDTLGHCKNKHYGNQSIGLNL